MGVRIPPQVRNSMRNRLIGKPSVFGTGEYRFESYFLSASQTLRLMYQAFTLGNADRPRGEARRHHHKIGAVA